MNTNDYLMHHGIKGQKWGVRRFQNPDGTRTTAGKKREKEKRMDHDELVKSTDANALYKNRGQLSDRELQDRLNRLRNEEELKRMSERASNGQNSAKKVLKDNGKELAKELSKNAMRSAAIKVGQKAAAKLLPLAITAIGSIVLPGFLFPEIFL